MKSIVTLLEQELEGAVEIRDKGFLHRYITLMAENFIQKEEQMADLNTIHSDIRSLTEEMKLNRLMMDKRFEDLIGSMNKRFEAVDKRFSMILTFMLAGFAIVSTLVTVYQFLG